MFQIYRFMKKTFFLLASLFVTGGMYAQISEWKNPAVPAVNKEYPVTEFVSYTNREDAVKNDYTISPYYKLLDGVWKHKRFSSTTELSENVFAPRSDVSGWADVRVPQKSADNPMRGNVTEIPSDVPMDVFHTTFHMPFAWADKQIFIEIGKARSGVTVFVNGEKAGYAEDSRNPVVYDITSLVKEGNNVLVIAAAGWSTGSQLEWGSRTYGGIEGGVWIKTLPKIRVRDFEIRTNLTDNYKNGVLDFGVIVKTHLLNTKSAKVYFELFSPEGTLLESASKEVELGMRQERSVHFDALIRDVKAWNAEQPNLYSVIVRIQYEGRYVENIRREIGFRSVENRDGQILVNGKPVRFRGINVSDFPSEPDAMTEAFQWMKRHQVNAVRTMHAPQSERFYALCDEYGFYVLSEANIDSRAYGFAPESTLGNNPIYLNAHMDRVQTSYERTKNHPSVVMFSLGDQGGNGYNFYETYLWIKSREKVRPVLYPGAGREWNTDVFAPNAFDPADYAAERQTASPRPYFIVNDSDQAVGWDKHPEVQGYFGGYWQGETNSTSVFSSDFTPVLIESLNNNNVEITNRFDFTSLDQFDLVYEVTNGKNRVNGAIPCSLAPGESGKFAIPVPSKWGLENTYHISVVVRESFGCYRKGDVLGEVQYGAEQKR